MKKAFILASLIYSVAFLLNGATVTAQPPIAKEAKDKTEEAIRAMKKDDFAQAALLLEEALKFTKYYPEAQINLCTSYYQLQRFDDAKEMCDLAIKSAPNLKAQPYVVLGEIYLKEDNYDLSITHLNKAATIDKKSSNIFNLLGLNHLKKNDLDKAIQNFNEAVSLDDSNFESCFYLANTLYQMQRLKESQGIYEKCLKINPKNPVVYYKLATSYQEDNNNEKAIETYNRFLKISPNNITAHLRLGEIYDRTGDTKTALKSYDNAIKISSDQPSPYLAKAKIFARTGEIDQAIENFEKALALNPLLVDAHRDRGKLYLRSGKIENALTDFTEAVRIDPTAPGCFVCLAIAHEKNNEPEKAIENLNQALSLDSNYGLAHLGLAKLALRSAKYDEALTHYDNALKSLPDRLDIVNERGVASYLAGQTDKAIADWDVVLSRDANDSAALINKANIEILAGNLEVANQLVEKVDVAKASSAALANTQGVIALLKNDPAAAQPFFEKAVQEAPDSRQPLLNLSIVDLLQKNAEAAKDRLMKAKDMSGLNNEVILSTLAASQLFARQYDQALQLYAEIPENQVTRDDQYNRAWAQINKKDYQPAQQTLTDLAGTSPDYMALNNLAYLLYQKSQYPDAVKYLKEAIALKPDLKQLSLNLASVYYAQGNYNESVKIVQSLGATSETPGSDRHLANLYFNRGFSLAQQKKYAQALAEFKKAAETVKDSASLLSNIGAMHFMLGELDQAKESFDQALDLDSNCAECIANKGIFEDKSGNFTDAYKDFTNYVQVSEGDTKKVTGWIETYKRLYHYE